MLPDLSNLQKKVLGYFTIVIATSLLSFLLLKTEALLNLENTSWDWRVRHIAEHSQADPKIKIVMIDQNALEHLADEEQQFWPWPRELYVPVIEFLRRSGAAGVAFDILFTEQSHYSVSDDEALAASMKGTFPVVAAVALRQSESKNGDDRLETFVARQKEDQQKTRFDEVFLSDTSSRYPSATLPVKEILSAASAFGNVSAANDSDGIFRHVLPGSTVEHTSGNVPILSLPFALFHAVNPAALSPPSAQQGDRKLAVRFAGPPHTYPTYSFSAVLRSFQQVEAGDTPMIPLSEFKDSYVFVGMDAPGLLDLRPTPLSPSFPGVEYHATSLDNIIHDSFIRTASFAENLVFTFAVILFASAGALFTQRARTQVPLIGGVFIALVATAYFLGLNGYWIQMIVPLITGSIAALLGVSLHYQLEGYHSRFIKRAFRYYVSPEMVDRIIKDPKLLFLGGERKELSIFFCDIARFTSISESMEPAKLVQFLNTFLTEMTKIIMAHGGTVDKYIGDAIVAFWNAPVAVVDHAERAVKAAIACQMRTAELRESFQQEYQQELRIRIGVHTGIASVGNFGSVDRFNYTVIGDAANLAARLEGANKSFGTELLFSESSYNGLQNKTGTIRIGSIRVVGRAEAIGVYSAATDLSAEDRAQWNEAERLFAAGKRAESEKIFQGLSHSKMATVYLQRFAKDGTEVSADWSPVWNLLDK